LQYCFLINRILVLTSANISLSAQEANEFRGERVPGLPFDSKKGIIPNHYGAVKKLSQLDSSHDHSTGKPRLVSITKTLEVGVYAAGWIKRGPSGVIASNIFDAQETVATIIEDWPHILHKFSCSPSSRDLSELLRVC
jgi:NADPH-dependent glutamate synthase beta subunit-like oxidoreductase